jgi:23S rRNA (uracil1939-C5)-methyltransferase
MTSKGPKSVAAPDIVILNPPRAGAGTEIMRHLPSWDPAAIIYVSCDPQTLVRDLSVLRQCDYRLDSVEGLDLFPQTYHFETVVQLSHK